MKSPRPDTRTPAQRGDDHWTEAAQEAFLKRLKELHALWAR